MCAGSTLLLSDNLTLLPNNSVILADNFGQIPPLQCITDSASSLDLIGPSKQIITHNTGDIFVVVVGSNTDPGLLNVSLESGRQVQAGDQGVYECKASEGSSLSFGIYLQVLAGITFTDKCKVKPCKLTQSLNLLLILQFLSL